MSSQALTRSLDCRGLQLVFGDETIVMGILNVTPDSFSDGGRFAAVDVAVAHAERMVSEGAGIIDIGGQSTRPGFVEVSAEEEIARVIPVIEVLAGKLGVPLSIDTYKPEVARAALKAGAHLINDIHGLQHDPRLAELAVEYGAPVIAMHQEPNFKETGDDPVDRLRTYFERTAAIAAAIGLERERLVVDPGIGFGKTQSQNLGLMARIGEMRDWGWPVLLGASRKSVIGNVLDQPVDQRLEGTLATTAIACWQGVEIVRVHDVAANVRAVRMTAALRGKASQ